MPVIGGDTPVRLGLVITVVGLLLSAVFAAGAAHWRLNALEHRFEQAAPEVRLQRLEDGMVRLEAATGRIEGKLDDLTAGSKGRGR